MSPSDLHRRRSAESLGGQDSHARCFKLGLRKRKLEQLGKYVELPVQSKVPPARGTWYLVPGTRHLHLVPVPGTWHLYLAPGTCI